MIVISDLSLFFLFTYITVQLELLKEIVYSLYRVQNKVFYIYFNNNFAFLDNQRNFEYVQ